MCIRDRSEADCGGFGITAKDVSPSVIEEAYERGVQVGFTVPRLSGDLTGVRNPSKRLLPSKPFTLLPSALVDPEGWVDVAAGRWKYSDHITLGEGRAVIRLLDILTRSIRFHRAKVVSLQDNRGVSGSMGKGKSPSGPLNYLLRRKAARCLAAQLYTLLPWVESCRMPADALSRRISGHR